ncbi:sensor histidine kinase [Geomonas anaerohicana]|uniref:histidine kinase n=1 Tax=Geomonas anaerohicana TaxID=2798583 RepID=A0ABS0YH32_9BACT|nr:ATP-binding protein [Geomonas anaerohicana]MBJ6751234.1 hypothetical protein [Geomonas anaerohicana]
MPSSEEGTHGLLEERVLMLLPEGRDAWSMPRVLERINVAYKMCATQAELCAEIGKGAGALLIEEEALSSATKQCLVGALSGGAPPAWSELPIIVLLRPGPETQTARDALLLPGDVTLVERPVRVNTLVAIIRSALRSRRRQYLVRDQLQALEEAKTRYHTLFVSIDEGFCIIEMLYDETGKPLDYRFLETSPSFEKQTGLRHVEGKTIRELAPGQEEYWFEIYGRIIETGEPLRFERPAQKQDRWFDVYAFRFGPPENRQVAILCNDITDRKRTESELRQAKDELEVRVQERTEELTRALQSLRSETEERLRGAEELRAKEQQLMQQSRMAAMGEMIGYIAHQWRQPLNALALIVQETYTLYKMGQLHDEVFNTSTAQAMRVIRQMSHTIDDFTSFFKPDKQKVPFSVQDILAKTIKLVDASFRHANVAVSVIPQDDTAVEGFPNEFSQVLLNLLMNAKDALLERNVREPAIAIRIFRENGKAVTTITDNAGGIPEDLMERIFDPYFTTKGPDKGTGIGLYMAKAIIEKHMGGRLSVRNVGGGAEFRIEV